MQVNKTFDAVLFHEPFRVTARAAEPYAGQPQVQLVVEDTKSGATVRLGRAGGRGPTDEVVVLNY